MVFAVISYRQVCIVFRTKGSFPIRDIISVFPDGYKSFVLCDAFIFHSEIHISHGYISVTIP